MVKCCAQIIVIGLICRLTLGSPHERFERSFGSGLLGILGGGSSRHDSTQGSDVDQQVSEVGSVYGSDGGYGQSGRHSYGSSRWEQEGASGISSVHHHHHGVGHGYHGHDHHGAEHVHGSGFGRGISGGHEHSHEGGLLGAILGGHRHDHHHSWDHGIDGGHGHTHQGGGGSTQSNWYHGMSHGHGSGHYEGGHGHAHGGENVGHAGSTQEGISVVEHGQVGTGLGTGNNRDVGQVQQGVRTYTHTIHYHGVNQDGSPIDKDNVQGQVHESGGQVLVQEHGGSEPTGISGIEHDQEGGGLHTTDDQNTQQVQQGVRTYTHTVYYQGVTQEGGSPNDKGSVQGQVHGSEGQVLVGDNSVSRQTNINVVEHDGEGNDFGTGSGQEVGQVQQGVRTYTHTVHYQGVTQEKDSPRDKEITQEQVDGSGGQVIVQDNTDTESTNINEVDHDRESDKLTTGVDQDQDASQVQHGVRTHRVSYHGVTQDGLSHDKDTVQEEVHKSGEQVPDKKHGESEPTSINGVDNNDHDDPDHLGSDGQELVNEQDELQQTIVDEAKPDHEGGTLGGKQTSTYESTYETQYKENDRELPVDTRSALEPDGSSSKPQNISEIDFKQTQDIGKPAQPEDYEKIPEDSDVDQQSKSEVNPVDESDDNIPQDGTENKPVQDNLEGDEGVGSTDGSNTLPDGGAGKPINIEEIGDSQQYNAESSPKPINEDDIEQDPKTEENGGLEHISDSDQDQQSVSSVDLINEESLEPVHIQESDELNQKVTKVQSIQDNKGSDESSPDEITEIRYPKDSGEEDPNKISSNEQVFESDHPSGSGSKPVQGTTGDSTTTRHTVTTVEYVRNNNKPGGSRVVEGVYGNDKYTPGSQGGENIGQDGFNQVSDNGEITQKEVRTTYSQQVSQGGSQVGNPNLDNIQSGSSSGIGGVVHEVVETVVGHIGGHGQVVQGITRQGSNVLGNEGLGQEQTGSGLGPAGVIQEVISSHGRGVLGNVGTSQQGFSQQVSQVGRQVGTPNLDSIQGGSSSGFGGVVHEVVETVVGHIGGESGHGQVVQGITRQGSNLLGNVGLGQEQTGSGLGPAGVIQEIVSSHGGGLLGNVGMGQQQGGSGSGHMRVVQEVVSSHGGNVLGNVGLGQSQGGSGSGHMQVVQEVTRHGSTVLETVGLGGKSRGIGGLGQSGIGQLGSHHRSIFGSDGLGHSQGIGGLGHGGISRITSHGSGVLQQVGSGHSYGGRSGGQGYEGGSQSASSYRTSGGSYGTYSSRSGSSGGGLAGGLLGLG